jgi:hypothetical protein
MRNIRIARILGFVWEILRFGFVSLTLIYYINPSPDLTISFFVILAASGQLLIPAGLILMAFSPDRYQHLSKLLALGKGLSVIAVVAVLITQSRVYLFFARAAEIVTGSIATGIPQELPIFVVYAVAFIGLVDLVMALFLAQSGEVPDG